MEEVKLATNKRKMVANECGWRVEFPVLSVNRSPPQKYRRAMLSIVQPA